MRVTDAKATILVKLARYGNEATQIAMAAPDGMLLRYYEQPAGTISEAAQKVRDLHREASEDGWNGATIRIDPAGGLGWGLSDMLSFEFRHEEVNVERLVIDKESACGVALDNRGQADTFRLRIDIELPGDEGLARRELIADMLETHAKALRDFNHWVGRERTGGVQQFLAPGITGRLRWEAMPPPPLVAEPLSEEVKALIANQPPGQVEWVEKTQDEITRRREARLQIIERTAQGGWKFPAGLLTPAGEPKHGKQLEVKQERYEETRVIHVIGGADQSPDVITGRGIWDMQATPAEIGFGPREEQAPVAALPPPPMLVDESKIDKVILKNLKPGKVVRHGNPLMDGWLGEKFFGVDVGRPGGDKTAISRFDGEKHTLVVVDEVEPLVTEKATAVSKYRRDAADAFGAVMRKRIDDMMYEILCGRRSVGAKPNEVGFGKREAPAVAALPPPAPATKPTVAFRLSGDDDVRLGSARFEPPREDGDA